MKHRHLLTLCSATALSLNIATAAVTPLDASKLRAKANEVFGPLPDKMPGAEKDTPLMVKLGEKLYFEKEVSDNRQMSCNDCHLVDQNRAGVDNQPTSLGVKGKRGERNSPTTLNAGFHFAQFWDGRAKTLEEQAKGPVLNPVEMAMADEATVIKRLEDKSPYKELFAKAFPESANPVTYDNFARAVASFERTLVTHDRFDDFLKGDDKALKPEELKGLHLFMDSGCTTCHTGPALGGNSFQKLGVIHKYANTNDLGRLTVTKEEWDEMRFKVPSLRNIEITFPYFHDGAVSTLNETVKQMAYLQLGKEMTAEEIQSIETFLKALTDKERKPAVPTPSVKAPPSKSVRVDAR